MADDQEQERVYGATWRQRMGDDGPYCEITCPTCRETIGEGGTCPCGITWYINCYGVRESD